MLCNPYRIRYYYMIKEVKTELELPAKQHQAKQSGHQGLKLPLQPVLFNLVPGPKNFDILRIYHLVQTEL